MAGHGPALLARAGHGTAWQGMENFEKAVERL